VRSRVETRADHSRAASQLLLGVGEIDVQAAAGGVSHRRCQQDMPEVFEAVEAVGPVVLHVDIEHRNARRQPRGNADQCIRPAPPSALDDPDVGCCVVKAAPRTGACGPVRARGTGEPASRAWHIRAQRPSASSLAPVVKRVRVCGADQRDDLLPECGCEAVRRPAHRA
jgi:hypothetical protein